MGANPGETPEQTASRLGIGGLHRHVLLCTGPECVSPEEGQKAWDELKAGISRANLSKYCFRTKVGCLRLCNQGPIAVVYPEGVWYKQMDATRIPDLINQHLVEGKPLEDCVVARDDLAPPPAGHSGSS